MSKELQIVMCGGPGVGKSTVAVLIQQYLRSIGYKGVTVRLTNNEMPPCPTDLLKRSSALIDDNVKITIVETQTRSS